MFLFNHLPVPDEFTLEMTNKKIKVIGDWVW